MIDYQGLVNSDDDPVFLRFTRWKTPPFRFWKGEMAFYEYGDGWTPTHACFDGMVEISEDELPKTVRRHARRTSPNREGPAPTCGHQACQDMAERVTSGVNP